MEPSYFHCQSGTVVSKIDSSLAWNTEVCFFIASGEKWLNMEMQNPCTRSESTLIQKALYGCHLFRARLWAECFTPISLWRCTFAKTKSIYLKTSNSIKTCFSRQERKQAKSTEKQHETATQLYTGLFLAKFLHVQHPKYINRGFLSPLYYEYCLNKRPIYPAWWYRLIPEAVRSKISLMGSCKFAPAFYLPLRE